MRPLAAKVQERTRLERVKAQAPERRVKARVLVITAEAIHKLEAMTSH